jgi:hypothetical protein
MKSIFSLICFLFLLIALPGCFSDFEGGTSKPMQEDFDKIRLDHLFKIDSLISEYYSKTGHYPLAGRALGSVPIIVKIATESQIKRDDGRVLYIVDLITRSHDGVLAQRPERVEVLSLQELGEALSSGLGRPVALPMDRQKVPVNKPSMYLYVYYDGVYDVSAYLHNQFSFARHLGDFYYKVTISNRTNAEGGIWTVEDLANQEEFLNFIRSPFNKPGYEPRYRF